MTAWAACFPGAATDRLDWVGAVLGLVAALVYTAYILTGDRLLSGIALVSTVGAIVLFFAGLARSGPRSPRSACGRWTRTASPRWLSHEAVTPIAG